MEYLQNKLFKTFNIELSSLASGDNIIFTFDFPILILSIIGLVTEALQNTTVNGIMRINNGLSDIDLSASTSVGNKAINTLILTPFNSGDNLIFSTSYYTMGIIRSHIDYPLSSGSIILNLSTGITGKISFGIKYLNLEADLI